ncbi:MAG TPA: DUF3943 domain-containing protein [Polyangiaceae bacterium]|nr:DUF3943 domain-containing protein [Polyangiaceae bacterium]
MRGWMFGFGAASVALLAGSGARAQALPNDQKLAVETWTLAAEDARPAHHGRALWEMGGGLVLGTTGYWLLKRSNVVDWDDPKPLSRFDGSAWVLDNNSIGVNFLGHPAMGGGAYAFARGNHHSVLGAFGYSFLTSFLWEFVIEFKEKVSVNDVLVTPATGVPLGEFFHKLGLYLDTGHHHSVGFDALRWTLGSGVSLDRALDGRPAPRVAGQDSLGFSAEIWHEFAARYGVFEVQTPRDTRTARYELGVAGRLVTLPGYGTPTAFGRPFWGAEIADFALDAEASRHGTGLRVRADTVLAGYHAQRFERSTQRLRGVSVTLGTSLGYEYLRSAANRYPSVERALELPDPELGYHAPNRREQYGALQLPGLAAEFRWLGASAAFEGRARLQPSFAGVGAAAFYQWSAAHLDDRTKNVLHRQGYFYGWGGAANVLAKASLGPLRAGFELLYGAYRSQDGMDRHPEQLSVDVPVTADVLRYQGSIGVAPTPAVTVALEVGVRRFRSNVDGFELTVRSVERGLRASWVF